MKFSFIPFIILMFSLSAFASIDGESTQVEFASIKGIDGFYKINANEPDEMVMNCSDSNGSIILKEMTFEFSDLDICKDTARKLKEGRRVKAYLSYLSRYVHFDE